MAGHLTGETEFPFDPVTEIARGGEERVDALAAEARQVGDVRRRGVNLVDHGPGVFRVPDRAEHLGGVDDQNGVERARGHQVAHRAQRARDVHPRVLAENRRASVIVEEGEVHLDLVADGAQAGRELGRHTAEDAVAVEIEEPHQVLRVRLRIAARRGSDCQERS